MKCSKNFTSYSLLETVTRRAKRALFFRKKKRLLQFLLRCGIWVGVCVCVCMHAEDLTAAPVNEMLWKFHQLLLIRSRKKFFFLFFRKFFFSKVIFKNGSKIRPKSTFFLIFAHCHKNSFLLLFFNAKHDYIIKMDISPFLGATIFGKIGQNWHFFDIFQ